MVIPIRQCIGCMLRRPKAELIRIVFDKKSKQWIVDEKKKLPGRGFYICKNDTCFRLALKRRRININTTSAKLLKTPLSLNN